MFKSVLLVALGFAAASANFLSVDIERYLQVTNATTVNTACTRSTTAETCTQSGYCCATVTRNGTALNNSVCLPAEFHQQVFNNVSGVNYIVACNNNTAATTVRAAQTACNATTPCTASGAKCCTRANTLGGVASTTAARSVC